MQQSRPVIRIRVRSGKQNVFVRLANAALLEILPQRHEPHSHHLGWQRRDQRSQKIQEPRFETLVSIITEDPIRAAFLRGFEKRMTVLDLKAVIGAGDLSLQQSNQLGFLFGDAVRAVHRTIIERDEAINIVPQVRKPPGQMAFFVSEGDQSEYFESLYCIPRAP